jgi:hypothetical protein
VGLEKTEFFKKTITDAGNSKDNRKSSLNNIGVANITLGYISRNYRKSFLFRVLIFQQMVRLEEYRVERMPLKYQLAQTDERYKIANNADNIALLDSNLDLFSQIKAEIIRV